MAGVEDPITYFLIGESLKLGIDCAATSAFSLPFSVACHSLYRWENTFISMHNKIKCLVADVSALW